MNTQSGYLLVVEDIPDILKLLDATLKFKGYRVLTARNGEEALEVIQKERPLMIITDILMPKMDGFSLCLLYTSDAADERSSVDLGGRRLFKKKKIIKSRYDHYSWNN